MLGRIHHIAIICSNYAASKHFYVDVLGLKVVRELYRAERDSYKLDLQVGEQYQIELFSFPNPPARPSRPEACGLRHLAFEVEMCAKLPAESAHTESMLNPYGSTTLPASPSPSLPIRTIFRLRSTSGSSRLSLRVRHLFPRLVIGSKPFCHNLQRGIELHERVLDCRVRVVA